MKQPAEAPATGAVPPAPAGMSVQELLDGIYTSWEGNTRMWVVYLPGSGGGVYWTRDERDMALFVAELKARILLKPGGPA